MTPWEKFVEAIIDRIPIVVGFIMGVLVTLLSVAVGK